MNRRYSGGKVTDAWLNDTKGWSAGSRVFVDADKFEKCKITQKGFAAEFFKKWARWVSLLKLSKAIEQIRPLTELSSC